MVLLQALQTLQGTIVSLQYSQKLSLQTSQVIMRTHPQLLF